MANDETGNSKKDICYARGDTYGVTITITDDSNAAFDLTGYVVTLTVNSVKNPADDTTELFKITGTVATPTNGVAVFTPTSANTNQAPGKYYYDIQLVGNGNVYTPIKGVFRIVQDINKT